MGYKDFCPAAIVGQRRVESARLRRREPMDGRRAIGFGSNYRRHFHRAYLR